MIGSRPPGDLVRLADDVAELDQVEPGGLGEALRLTDGDERRVRDQVPRELHTRPGTDRSGADDTGRPREALTAPVDRVRPAAGHHDERAFGRAHRSPGDRRIDDVDALRLFVELLAVPGAMVEWIAITVFGATVVRSSPHDLAGLRVVEHAHRDHVAPLRRPRRRSRRRCSNAFVASLRTSYTSGWTRCFAIAAPICPRPMKPVVIAAPRTLRVVVEDVSLRRR